MTRAHRRNYPLIGAALCLVAWAVVAATLTLTPVPLGRDVPPPNWVPFADIYRLVSRAPGGVYQSAAQLLGNVALFVPLGWLLPALWRRLQSIGRVVGLSASISLAIELLQLFFVEGRWTSVDDVILNSFGALIGAVMFFAPRRLYRDTSTTSPPA